MVRASVPRSKQPLGERSGPATMDRARDTQMDITLKAAELDKARERFLKFATAEAAW